MDGQDAEHAAFIEGIIVIELLIALGEMPPTRERVSEEDLSISIAE